MVDLIFFDKRNIARFAEEHENRLSAVLRFSTFLNECKKKWEDNGHCEIRNQGDSYWLPLKDSCGCGWILK
jgi:hypothetical protein